MSVDWHLIGQPAFDRVVEALVRYRFGERVRGVNGRGGDGGIDIEVTLDDGCLWIIQLKYFPEGFSSQWRRRRTEIRQSFITAMQHQPDKWTLIVPCLCSTPAHQWVTGLNNGQRPPEIEVVDRDDLDAWIADAPEIDASVQRTASTEMERLATVYNMERAALLAGVPDVAARVRALGDITDTLDLDWAVDFGQRDGMTSVIVRPRDPDSPRRSPIGFTVEMGSISEHRSLYQDLMRNVGYATSETLHIPGEVVRSVRFDGPEFIAGDYPPGAVQILTRPSGAVGLPLELRACQGEVMVASFEGRITHAAPGPIGGSIEAAFCGGHLDVRLRLPHDGALTEPVPAYLTPGVDMSLNYGAVRPSTLEEVLSTRRVLRFATHLDARVNGDHLMTARASDVPQTAEDYDSDLLAFEQFAYDLDVVQRHTACFFDVPDTLQPGDRVRMRVARLLIEGHIVASPRAPTFTLELVGIDSPELRASLRQPHEIVWPAGPYAVTIAGRELIVGDVYAVHPQAIVTNGEEAFAALDAGEAQGFHVHFRPGDNPYFYLTLADVSRDEARRRSIAEWTLFGIDQPGTVGGQEPD